VPVISIVRGVVPDDQVARIREAYEAAIEQGLPDGIEATYLVGGDGGAVAILTVWRDRAVLDAMRATGQEPLARRLIREAGGQPSAEFLEVLAAAPR
jgi:hypothetical protein